MSVPPLADEPSAPPRPVRVRVERVGPWRLAMLLFFAVSGGAYGLEDVVGTAGPGMALVLIVLTPIVWSLPAALVVAELSTAIPEEGGYYAWAKHGLGPFWGFQEGWWSWVQSFVDMAIYPVLFATYLSTLLAEQFGVHILQESPAARWAVTLAVIWTFVVLNIRGVRTVGTASLVFGGFVLAPFVVMSIIGIAHLAAHPTPIWRPFVPPGSGTLGAFSTGLYVVMWNYFGWDAASTYAAEIENPQRNYPRALAGTLPLVTFAYLLPVIAGLGATNWSDWTAGFFPRAGAAVGGPWLGTWLAFGGMVTACGMFNSLLLSFSRVPFAMAADGYMPAALTKLHPTRQTPYVAIIVCGSVYSAFTLLDFTELVVLDVLLYAAALVPEFAALVALRIRRPEMPRPFRIPGGWFAIAAVCVAPLAVVGLAVASTVSEHGAASLVWPAIVLATGPLLYAVVRRKAISTHFPA